jgi:hypothetical protein
MKIINKTRIELMNDYMNKDFVICVAVNLDQNYLLLIDQTVSLIFWFNYNFIHFQND